MNEFCCKDWEHVSKTFPNLFVKDTDYDWLLQWIEITKDGSLGKINTYALSISYCPFCGKKLLTNKEQ